MEKKFRKGDVVWAKVRGFPWWPAIVKSINTKILKKEEEEEELRHTTLLVYFIGDNSHSELPINKVEKFTQKYEEFSKTKKKSLLNSIKLAKKIMSSEILFEKHLNELNKIEKGKKLRLNDKNEINHSDEESQENFPYNKDLLGMKRSKRKLIKKKENGTGPKIDFCVEDDFSKNIKINININVNNNTNNTLNITTIGKKIIDDDSEPQKDDSMIEEINPESMHETEIMDENCKLLEDLKESINSLLFYKINMPSSTSNKSIISSLDDIHNKLQIVKNSNIYELIKDFIPILNSFLYSHNQLIVTKSSELFSIIKEKILEELFDLNLEIIGNLHEKFISKSSSNFNLKNKPLIISDEFTTKLLGDLEKFKKAHRSLENENSFLTDHQMHSNSQFKRITRKKSHGEICPVDFDESFTNNDLENNSLDISRRKRNLIKLESFERDPSDLFVHDNERCNFSDNLKICNKTVSCDSIMTLNLNNHNNSEITFNENNIFKDKKDLIYSKKKFSPLDSNQIRFLFKGFFGEDEENLNIEDRLINKFYTDNFFKNVYNKYNGLTERLACKRKHVCIKLLQILKLFLPNIDLEELKKTIIFLEYNIRTKDPTLGKIYKQNLELFYDRLKEILSLATESLNSLSKQKSKT